MDFAYQYAWLIPLLPLAAALIIGTGLITFNESTNKLRSLWSVLSVSATGGAAVIAFNLLWSQIQGHTPYTYTFEWAQAGLFHLNMGFVIDHLTSLMLVIVTTVAFLVQIYTDEGN